MKPKVLPKGMWSKSIHYFYSLKNQSYCWCESMLERDALLLMEFDDDIEAYKTQPISIQYKNSSGKISRYTPDYLYKRKSRARPGFHEVKMAARVDDELINKLALVNVRIKKAYGTQLEIISDTEIRVGRRIDNLMALYSYRRLDINNSDAVRLLNNMPSEFCYGDLIDHAKRLGAKNVTPLALLAHGRLTFDTTTHLLAGTKISKK